MATCEVQKLTPVRPAVRFLSEPLIEQILAEARELLSELGTAIENDQVTSMLLEAGARKVDGRVLIGPEMVDRAIESAPSSFRLHDRNGKECADLGGSRIHFTPGSAAISVLDEQTGKIRPPKTRDYLRYVRVVDRLPAIDYQSTALIPSDVHELVSDSYRLYLSLLYGPKPVVTGAFTIEAMATMVDMLLAVRGDKQALAEAPLAVFSCAPTAPLKWSDVVSQNVVDCAQYRIPVEFISMPLTGFVAPGTLVGTLIQHTAETLSGLVISQTASSGTPILWGGSPAIFDYRFETTPMAAIETQMICCAYSEIGKHLGLPTQAYIGLSDAKDVDAQAGLESASGAMLAALAGINSISGPGMLDFESCQSLEKLVVDHEICAAAKRMIQGVIPRDGDFPSRPHFDELNRDGHLLIADHTRRWFREEVRFPGPVIERANRARHLESGASSVKERARAQIEKLLKQDPNMIDDERASRLDEVMLRAAKNVGMEALPERHG